MNTRLRRPIRDEEIRAYEEDGVVWLPGILDLEWAGHDRNFHWPDFELSRTLNYGGTP